MLIALYNSLLAHRSDLGRQLAEELADLGFDAVDATGDSADGAFENSRAEVSSQLAAWDARELSQIDQALARLKRGKDGLGAGCCENCRKRIPVGRLRALPYTTLCINCERDLELHPDQLDRRRSSHWNRVREFEDPPDDKQVQCAVLAMASAGSQWS